MELKDVLILIFGSIVCYLLGGLSVARLITKKNNGGIVKEGSGNPGTMNMLRNHGVCMGVLTLLTDALKGALPALFGLLYFSSYGDKISHIALFLFGFFAVIGHIFPIYHKFRGGKGIATTFGVFFVVDPITSAILFGILIVTLYFIKIGSIVSLLFITINAVVQSFKDYANDNIIMNIIMWVMVLIDIVAHKQNLLRLIDNKENSADLQEAFDKDIERLQQKKQRKLERTSLKQEKIKNKYNEKISKRHNKYNKKLEDINKNNSSKTENIDTSSNN